MSFKNITDRIEAIAKQIEQSAANHNFLLGALQEAKALYDLLSPEVAALVPGAAPVIASIDAIEATATADVSKMAAIAAQAQAIVNAPK